MSGRNEQPTDILSSVDYNWTLDETEIKALDEIKWDDILKALDWGGFSVWQSKILNILLKDESKIDLLTVKDSEHIALLQLFMRLSNSEITITWEASDLKTQISNFKENSESLNDTVEQQEKIAFILEARSIYTNYLSSLGAEVWKWILWTSFFWNKEFQKATTYAIKK